MENLKFRYYITFIDHLFDGIKSKWPENTPQILDGGDWELKEGYEEKLSEVAKYNIGMEAVIERRKEFYNDMMNTKDIVNWCEEHIQKNVG
jgi:hypothetical protein